MADKPAVGCKRPSAKVENLKKTPQTQTPVAQGDHPMIQIGQKAPDFTAPAYFKKNLYLLNYRITWENG